MPIVSGSQLCGVHTILPHREKIAKGGWPGDLHGATGEAVPGTEQERRARENARDEKKDEEESEKNARSPATKYNVLA